MKTTMTPVNISKKIKNNQWTDSFIFDNIDEIKKSLKFNNPEIKNADTLNFLKFIFSKNITANIARKYYNNCMDFDLNRYKEYLLNKKAGDCKSKKFFYFLYGKFAEIKREKMLSSRKSPWDVEQYAKKHNVSIDEAAKKIKETLKNKCTSLAGFIKRHGEEKGTNMFNEWLDKCKNTEESFIKRYGEENGKKKWEEHCLIKKTVNPRCKEYWFNLGITDEDEIEKKISDFQLNNAGLHMDYLIKRYGVDIALTKMEEINSKKDVSSLKYFIQKYGDTPEAYSHYEKACELKDAVSVKHFLSKGYTLEEAEELNKEEVSKRKCGGVSKESVLFFNDIIDELKLKSKKIHTNDNEWFIYDTVNKKFFLYDFAIFSNDVKCIIEYNGSAFHPSRNLSEEDFLKWKSPYSKESASIVRAKDERKKELALNEGFLFLEVWSDDIDNKKKAIDFLKTNLKI